MSDRPGILFTAFEPSGDEHAAGAIARLRELRPDLPVYALGGAKMAAAGAELIETTTGRSAMGAGALGKIGEQWALRRRLKRWLAAHPLLAHVPTDSPAANWAICRMVKRSRPRPCLETSRDREGAVPNHRGPPLPHGRGSLRNRSAHDSGAGGGGAVESRADAADHAGPARVIHLVAPQVWAWAPWRVRRLRRWSDRVLCILPFEPAWFAERGVEAEFIGHPLFDHPLDEAELDRVAAGYPPGRPRVALLPGSRPGEIAANGPVMRAVFERLTRRFPEARGLIAAVDAEAERSIGAAMGAGRGGADAAGPGVVAGETEAVLRWADVVLSVSGTATLHVARHRKPMAIVYAVRPLLWHGLGRWLVDTRTFTLPNLIAAGGPGGRRAEHIVREFVPWPGGDVTPIVREMASLIDSPARRAAQERALGRVLAPLETHQAGRNAARAILKVISSDRSGWAES